MVYRIDLLIHISGLRGEQKLGGFQSRNVK